MLVLFQWKLATKFNVVAVVIQRVYQQGVEIIKLYRKEQHSLKEMCYTLMTGSFHCIK